MKVCMQDILPRLNSVLYFQLAPPFCYYHILQGVSILRTYCPIIHKERKDMLELV